MHCETIKSINICIGFTVFFTADSSEIVWIPNHQIGITFWSNAALKKKFREINRYLYILIKKIRENQNITFLRPQVHDFGRVRAAQGNKFGGSGFFIEN